MIKIHLALASVALLGLSPLAAHAAGEPEKVTSASGPTEQKAGESKMERRANHIEGHIAFVKAEIMITPAQEAAWDKVADAMRADVKDYEALDAKIPDTDAEPSAPDSLNERLQFAQLRADGEKRFLGVFKPLYDSLSPQQKQAADDLFATHDED